MLGALGAVAVTPRAIVEPPVPGTLVERNDAAVTRLLEQQIRDTASPFCGAVSDQYGLHGVGAASGLIETLAASFVHPQSTFHDQPELLARSSFSCKNAKTSSGRSRSGGTRITADDSRYHRSSRKCFIRYSTSSSRALLAHTSWTSARRTFGSPRR